MEHASEENRGKSIRFPWNLPRPQRNENPRFSGDDALAFRKDFVKILQIFSANCIFLWHSSTEFTYSLRRGSRAPTNG